MLWNLHKSLDTARDNFGPCQLLTTPEEEPYQDSVKHVANGNSSS